MRSRSRQPSTRRPSALDDPEQSATSVITEISASGRREGRFDVVVGGKVAAVLSADAISQLALHTGDEWTPPLAERAAVEGESLRVFDRALAMLAARARSERELRLALLRKREPEPLVEAAVARLLSLGALNDALFARQFVRARITRSGFSARRLQAELARRGVAREAADAAISEVSEEESVDPAATLERLARRKLATMSRFDSATRRRRLFAFLSRRGYDSQEILRLMKSLSV